MKFNGLLLFPIALIIIIAIATNPKKLTQEWSHTVTNASLHDSLPPSFFQHVNVQEIQGFQVSTGFHSNTYYFEYTANHNQVLKALSMLPFAADSSRADVEPKIISGDAELKRIKDLLKEQDIARAFHKTGSLNTYTVYECLKVPQHHFVLLSKESDKVIHIIQQG
jgi:hypothetical protein